MPMDLTNPAIIRVLKEAYEKEKHIRVHWISKNTDKLKKAITLDREPKNHYVEDVYKHTMLGVMPMTVRDHIDSAVNRRKVPCRDARTIPGVANMLHDHSLIKIGLGDAEEDPRLARPDNDLNPDPIMRPVDPKLKKVLLKSKVPLARERYFKERYKLLPEKRFYLPECSSWDYGWRMKDSKMVNPREYARNLMLQRTLRSRVGPQPDPAYYQKPTVPGYAKCTNI
ncbi:uncharacterized protein LOC118271924 [Spodoptera frugiperda]|uniref:Uncharacterized protein LOC118271924 n=1 Tax=Spodoptera frugiperda TaxID=7108 RepID=A0A9R0D887_SPOFR|nr:uncharacterized protein LOC118271924 [Spodoptera frugiperda]